MKIISALLFVLSLVSSAYAQANYIPSRVTDMDDVNVTSHTNDYGLFWNSSQSKYMEKAGGNVTGGGIDGSALNANNLTSGTIAFARLSIIPLANGGTNANTSNATTGQILRFDGTSWVASDRSSTIGAAVSYYFNDSASDISTYYDILTYPSGGSEEYDSKSVTSNETLIEAYASVSGGLGGAQIDAGTWTFDIYCNSTNIAGLDQIWLKVYSRTAGGVETSLFNVTTGDLGNAAIALRQVSSVQPAFTLSAATDRLVIKAYANTTSAVARTVGFTHGGTSTYSRVTTPLVMRHNDLAGLQGGTTGQYNHLTNAQLSALYATANARTDTGMTGNGGYVYMSNQSNRMGIGVTGTATKLAVQNSAGNPFILRISDSNAADKLVVTEAGNVGIGTTAPGTAFHIISSGANLLRQQRTGGITADWISNFGSGNYQLLDNENGKYPLVIEKNSSNDTIHVKSGDIGIGTTAPTQKLDVAGGINATSGNFSTALTVGGNAVLNVTSNLNASLINAGTIPAANLGMIANTSITGMHANKLTGTVAGAQLGVIAIANGGTGSGTGSAAGLNNIPAANITGTFMTLNVSGNVGIGTTAPNAKLHVVGDANITGNISATGINYTGTAERWQSPTYGTYLDFNDQANVLVVGSSSLNVTGGNVVVSGQFYGDGGGITNITGGSSQWANVTGGINYASGNVGIGTTKPNALLHVAGTNQYLEFQNKGAAEIGIKFHDSSDSWKGEMGVNTTSGTMWFDCDAGRIYVPTVVALSPTDTEPTSPAKGYMYMNSTNNITYIYNGTSWKALY